MHYYHAKIKVGYTYGYSSELGNFAMSSPSTGSNLKNKNNHSFVSLSYVASSADWYSKTFYLKAIPTVVSNWTSSWNKQPWYVEVTFVEKNFFKNKLKLNIKIELYTQNI